MFYLRPWSSGTIWSCVLPRGRIYSVVVAPRRWISPSVRIAASKSSTGRNEDWPNEVFASERIRDRKSVFQAHATELRNVALLPTFLSYLTSLPSSKRATHCMYAYRTKGKNQGVEQLTCGQNDGGEGGSGDRLSRLLELSNYKNVVVVVFRWYGGIKLGSDRWKRISEVAKEALNKGSFVKSENPQQGSGAKARRK
ncbi:ribosomal protein S5 domain 2-like protein [Macrolepiota fuliginosa MF-IS2]|uniref:Ribosomal protein S5 domain 2-like protein n=1 Tax=Macrolepiota fuliginosa MF-IS2 TaxID=1400762 RepID=A0A9P5XRF6_9AGAR|nr:ribosomal protein S5 domain 2-like protein [Macrolepiota fuliginosa MF-IS2]